MIPLAPGAVVRAGPPCASGSSESDSTHRVTRCNSIEANGSLLV